MLSIKVFSEDKVMTLKALIWVSKQRRWPGRMLSSSEEISKITDMLL